ncbi:hypothetical protein SAMN02746066_03902 [Anaerosporobacter mobilis DSM 15930]|jgi:hypothetical protein|uniref:Uncharacterized protein n=1 Tax=Anaerosporobacter mobilis DSM 15930 TaxID=1120996 RepID=A0A1M7MP06_9FIRM|nr:hypothetical protein [Anaerosporobacter mobilis]SHM92245.1 hypothetical protein SAMN02746066_03902 [Anaerosporobacter mobilis DSM 15930]
MQNTENLRPFGTLEKDNDICYKGRWHPTAVPCFESILKEGLLSDMPKSLRKNIAYSLQYMQYLELQLDELNLHNVIITMIYKNYIITGTSIIEGIFCYLLKSSDLWKQKLWELDSVIKSNEYKQNSMKYKLETFIYKKIDPVDDEMNFDSMIKKMESKNILSLNHKAYPYIKKLKRLRNKVHLQINEHEDDTDWFNFNYIDYLWMRYVLHKVLTDDAFKNKSGKYIDFIKCNHEEIEQLNNDIKRE